MMRSIIRHFIFLAAFVLFISTESYAEKQIPIVVNGDEVEFLSDGKKVIAKGNVVIEYQESKLTADKVTVSDETKIAIAEGNVVLEYPKIDDNGRKITMIIKGSKAIYNFETQQGDLLDANIESAPFYGKSEKVKKISDSELKADKAYITTCNLDKPHYRLVSKQIFIYPNDKIVAKNVVLKVGEVPLFYIPRYVQRIDDKRPRVTVMPGKDKEWGYYLLTAWRYYLMSDNEGRIHFDYRERKDLSTGFTHKYKFFNLGDGLLKTYYMHERSIQPDHIYQEREEPTIERERFKIQWYHKAEIDERTNAILEYHKFSDDDFMKDYFEREYEKDSSSSTYFLLTHVRSFGTFSLLSRKRINRFNSEVERLPEFKFEESKLRILETPFYFSNTDIYSNLIKKTANSGLQEEAKRVHTFNELSMPIKVAIFNVNPFTGTRHTYYSESTVGNSNIIRSVFHSGVDVSTKFFRLFDVKSKFFGAEINRLRHVVTPTITYNYIHDPSMPSSSLINFDEIDSISRTNMATLSLENKLQTKRGNPVDLARLILSSNYLFNEPNGSRFDVLTSDLEITPVDWLRIEADSSYDIKTNLFTSINTDFYLTYSKWTFGLGTRVARKVNRQMTLQLTYDINPKWKLSIYERFYPMFTNLKEQEYVITRDLHCWEMSVSYNVTHGKGEEVWIAFKLKAFPEFGLEFNESYHAPKAGSQSGGIY